MPSKREEARSRFILIAIVCLVVFYAIFLQFLFPVLYEVDGYYHVSAARFIKDFGIHNKFQWTQFSTFKNFFSDKELIFHLSIIPFLYLSNNIVTAGKYAVIFYNIFFILVYIFILRKYLPDFLAGLFLLLPFISLFFTLYFVYLRPATLSNIFLVLVIYFLLRKKYIWVGVLSLLYPMAHVSFFMIIPFAVMCEILRYVKDREFCPRNIYAAIIGTMLGCILHPNFPNNLLNAYLNAVLVPLYSFRQVLDFGDELYPATTKAVLISDFLIFFTLNIVFWLTSFSRIKLSFSTLVWWCCTSIYLVLSFVGLRYWYVTNVLFFIFFASYIKDWLGERSWKAVLPKINIFIFVYAMIAFGIGALNCKNLKNELNNYFLWNSHYEDVSRWMQKYIPKGETIYHAFWSDSPYFICLNPKNNYLVVLDPIYMFYRYPKPYVLYLRLKQGKVKKPYKVLRSVFRVNYGYTRKITPLYRQIKSDTEHFKIMYVDAFGIVFKIINYPLQG